MQPHQRTALIFGASGQIGLPLSTRLRADGWRVLAVSRRPRVDGDGLHWLRGDFADPPVLPPAVDAIFSCGPLDLFARWLAMAATEAPRVVAFGSTSASTKQDARDEAERELARRLLGAEARLHAAAEARGAAATLLRPTLVYGAGRDATLTRIAAMARRWGRFVLPTRADGLRQPVHVDDLAAAALAACEAQAAHGRAYDLPGGERRRYREMVARVLACVEPRPALHTLPMPVFLGLLRLAQARGIAGGLGPGAVARMRDDLVFDADPAARDFGYAPRGFRPTPGMFG